MTNIGINKFSKGGVFCPRHAYLTMVTTSYDLVDGPTRCHVFSTLADQLFPLDSKKIVRKSILTSPVVTSEDRNAQSLAEPRDRER